MNRLILVGIAKLGQLWLDRRERKQQQINANPHRTVKAEVDVNPVNFEDGIRIRAEANTTPMATEYLFETIHYDRVAEGDYVLAYSTDRWVVLLRQVIGPTMGSAYEALVTQKIRSLLPTKLNSKGCGLVGYGKVKAIDKAGTRKLVFDTGVKLTLNKLSPYNT